MLSIYHKVQRANPRVICEVKKKYKEEYGKKDQNTSIRQW